MAALCNRAGHYIFALWFLLLSIFLLAYSQPSRIGSLPYFHTWCGLSANLGCRSETWCTRIAENARRKKLSKIRYLRTIVQLCQAVSLQLRHVSTIGKKLVKQQYFPHMSSQYGEVQPTSGWDRFSCLEHPSKFQLVLRLGFVTARHSSSGRQPNFEALNRGRHQCSAGQPSRWALGHISSFCPFLKHAHTILTYVALHLFLVSLSIHYTWTSLLL